ncbi:MAG TPA: hypothetical protein VFS88_01425 [Micavibrio sp.]|nr:hypothetical protein [Micavibrio sp.]
MQIIEKIKAGGIALIATALIIFVGGFAAWLTHIVNCFQDGEWGFLLVGALFFPLAVIHGIGIWLGLWD